MGLIGELLVLEARLPSPDGDKLGYGRDWEEARSHAGFDEPPSPDESFSEVLVVDGDPGRSREVAELVCRFHVEMDQDLPDWVRENLSSLLEDGHHASAVAYCFEMVWDRGFED